MRPFFETHSNHLEAYALEAFISVLHLHSNLEFIYMLRGETDVTIQRETRRLSAGSLAIIFPNQLHCYSNFSKDFNAAFLISPLSLAGGFADTLLKYAPEDPYLLPKVLHPQTRFAVDALLEEYAGQKDPAVCSALLQLLLARIMPKLTLHHTRSSDYEFLTYQITQYISEYSAEKLTLDVLAKHLGVSKYHLSHLFGEKMGSNFPTYLTRVRLDHAAALLVDSTLSVTEIGEEAGFSSQRTFFRAFRDRFGTTPLAYRKQFRLTETPPDSQPR